MCSRCPRCTCWALQSHFRQPAATSPETRIPGEPSGTSHSVKYKLIPLFGTPQLFLTCSTTSRASIRVMEVQHNSLRDRIVVKQRQQGVSEAVGWGNAGLRYLHKGKRGVQRGPSTTLKRTPGHHVCAVGAVHTGLCALCGELWHWTHFFSKGRVPASVMVPKKGGLGEQEGT